MSSTTARFLEGAVHHNHPLSAKGISERLFTFWFNSFVYNQIWEDPDVDLEAMEIRPHHRVYLLSNIGDLHWEHLVGQHELDRIGHGALTSFHAGVMKPDTAIYEQAERKFALVPASTVFIDDRAENIEAARARGWHGIVHRNFDDTRLALLRLGVEAAR